MSTSETSSMQYPFSSGVRTRLLAVSLLWVGLMCIGACSGQEASQPTASQDRNLSEIEMEEAVRSALAEREALDRAATLLPLMQGIHADNIEGAIRVFEAQMPTARDEDLRLFLAAWGELDPRAALDFALSMKTREDRQFAAGIVASDWAARGSSLAAVQYLRDVSELEIRDNAFGELMYGWVLSGDVEGATDFAADLPPGSGKEVLQENIVRALIQQHGIDGAIAWAEEVIEQRDDRFRVPGFRKVVRQFAHLDPVRASEWWQSHGDTPWARASLNAVVTEWTEKDPEAALDWIRRLPKGEAQEQAILKVAMRWSTKDLYGMKNFLESATLPESERSLLLGPFVRKAALSDPVMASTWVDQIEDGRAAAFAIVMVVRAWRESDPEAALEWLNAQNVPEPVRRKALESEPGLPYGEMLLLPERDNGGIVD